MEEYELMVVLKPLLPEDIRAGIEKRLSNVITKAKGKILATDVWGKRHLAYKIKGHEEGYYVVYKLEISKDQVDVISKELKLISDILRILLVREDKQ